MRQNRDSRLIALAVCGAIAASASLHPAAARAAPGKRDQAAALRVSIKWLTAYEPRFWVSVDAPGVCVVRAGGERRCPIAIVLKAWVGSTLIDHRCAAQAVLPPRGAKGRATRTSAHCTPVAAAAGEG